MKKNPIVTAQTKQNLQDAFWELYTVNRIESITVKEITTRAGYNRSTFYEYFADVYDVLDSIETTLIDELQQVPLQHLSTNELTNPVEMMVKIYVEHKDYLAVLLGPKGDPAFQQKMKDSMKPALRQLILQQEGTDKVRLEYTLEYALSAMIGVLNYWFQQKEPLPLEELMNLMGEISSTGVMGSFER